MIRPLTIGSLTLANNLMLAPMAGITNLPMRLMAREQGAALCFTEMVSVNGLVRDGRKTFELLKSTPADRPLGIQLFGDDPELLALLAKPLAVAFPLTLLLLDVWPLQRVVMRPAAEAPPAQQASMSVAH